MMNSGNLETRKKNAIYLIAETAFSHEGSLEYLRSQINNAIEAGVDAIKFQIMLQPEESYSSAVIASSEVFQWKFTEEEWKNIIVYAKKSGLEVVVLPVDMKSLEFCENNADLYEMIEVHSINFNHKFMLERIDKIPNKVVVLGEGGRTLEDIEYALNTLANAYFEGRILMMHGFQSFPTNPANLRMERIRKYKDFFGIEMGYADHTAYDVDDLSLIQIAYVNGARYFEKHLVVNKGERRTDYQAAVDVAHLKRIRKALEEIAVIQGENSNWKLNEAEEIYRGREKKIVALENIPEGVVFSEKNLGYKVTNEKKQFEQKDIEHFIGTVAKHDIEQGSTDIG